MEAHFYEGSWLLHSRDRISATMETVTNRCHGCLMSALLQWNADAHMPEISDGPKRITVSAAVCVGNSCRKPSDSINSSYAAKCRAGLEQPGTLLVAKGTLCQVPLRRSLSVDRKQHNSLSYLRLLKSSTANEVLGLNLLIGSVRAS